jgi:RimJ/RimL family protein N-acetyltransferase
MARLPDLPLFMAWRSDPDVVRYMPTAAAERLAWDAQMRWWKNSWDPTAYWTVTVGPPMEDPDLLAFKEPTGRRGRYGFRPVGTVHYDRKTHETGVMIGEKSLWGKGVGKAAMGLGLRKTVELVAPANALDEIWTVVHPDNIASRRMFESLGYALDENEQGRNGQLFYRWNVHR